MEYSSMNSQMGPDGILSAPVSLFQGSYDTTVQETIPLGEVLHRLQGGTYQAHVKRLRRTLATQGEDAYKHAKAQSLAFTPCCALTTRSKDTPWPEKLTSCTGLVHLDCDDLDDPEQLKTHLAQEPAVVFAFVSPRGNGLKVGIAATGIHDPESYKHAWGVVVGHMRTRYPDVHINVDEHVKYLHALCYVSYDPAPYVNAHAAPLVVAPPAPKEPRPAPAPDGRPDYALVMQALFSIPNHDATYNDWLDLGMALHSTEEAWARPAWDQWSSQSGKYREDKQDKSWRSFKADGKTTIGTLFHMAKEYGWTAPRRPQDHYSPSGLSSYFPREKVEAESPYKTTGKVYTSLNSLTSYPWPTLSEEAYYGLAGDYVRAIAPHSESDPAALLAQFLTVFGIASGRQRYFLVEATRHYPNIFCAIVGKTSRARKGTSYAHIDAQMHTADETWTLGNHIKGCGSGEGLIFAVRDARTSREAIKEKGRVVGYEDVEVDAGVQDKRALFQTGEFSSILKVCAREGNTLSEVIRDSWDTGYLRNATKNNPLIATEAHMGIIGHVTITEVQRLLTSTDAANGFGNRFIWICAQRSQLLPDGGAIASVNFQPLVSRLRASLAFARQPGAMQRDATAKAAWHAVYDMLSEDRTGLANTLLARSEAQVLRLSMLYALLDKSAVIRHAHLHAALALWHYAEESAAYIFGEATGDETADTIVSALSKAGAEGITKNTLLETVFQRNTPAGELERALHLLEQQRRIVATRRPPAGGKGRPAQVYTLLSNEVNEINEIKPNRYLIASNDAVKSMSLADVDVEENYEVNTPCIVCGNPERWQDGQVLRCVVCWPPAAPTDRR